MKLQPEWFQLLLDYIKKEDISFVGNFIKFLNFYLINLDLLVQNFLWVFFFFLEKWCEWRIKNQKNKLICSALSMAKDEIIWYFRHTDKPFPKSSKGLSFFLKKKIFKFLNHFVKKIKIKKQNQRMMIIKIS